MQAPLVMTVIGRDRPGLVKSLASIIADHGGNWLESRMCRLGGEFAGILRIHVPAEKQQALVQALSRLAAQGLSMVAQPDPAQPAPGAGKETTLEIVGHDRPGIVHQVTHALASQGVNVEELTTECVSAPMSGERLFKAQAKLLIPGSCNMATLRAELEEIAGELMVDVSFAEPRAGGQVK
jgi:glycine cleavage system regulatory protein